uniref:Uncharacterized protein n=1 Tax=Anguilla anguilla TaxID=7936 RepID=A0A0E9TUG9_ANGAN
MSRIVLLSCEANNTSFKGGVRGKFVIFRLLFLIAVAKHKKQ